MTNYYAEITGWGKCLPPATLSNDDLSTFLETSDEWIRTRTGIENRRISHCLLYTSPSPRDRYGSRMPSSA